MRSYSTAVHAARAACRALQSVSNPQGSSGSRPLWWELGALPVGLLVLGASTSLCEVSTPSTTVSAGAPSGPRLQIISLKSKQRVFFKYEKRIRELSSLEKVFAYFSSGTEADGEKYMLPQDVLSALVPTFPPSGTDAMRSGSLPGEPPARKAAVSNVGHIFKMFDVNADGKLSFSEFLLVLMLLSIPEDDLKAIFSAVDEDGSGTIDVHEFSSILGNIKPLPGSNETGTHGLMKHFFGSKLKGKITFPVLLAFVQSLHAELEVLEFNHYDVKQQGSIPGLDFGHSLVAAAGIRKVDALLDKVEAMPDELQDAKISLKDFKEYHKVTHHLQSLRATMEFFERAGKPMTRELFTVVCSRLSGTKLSKPVVEIIFTAFGTAEGVLDTKLFIDVQSRRSILPGTKGAEGSDPNSTIGQLTSLVSCVRSCTS